MLHRHLVFIRGPHGVLCFSKFSKIPYKISKLPETPTEPIETEGDAINPPENDESEWTSDDEEVVMIPLEKDALNKFQARFGGNEKNNSSQCL